MLEVLIGEYIGDVFKIDRIGELYSEIAILLLAMLLILEFRLPRNCVLFTSSASESSDISMRSTFLVFYSLAVFSDLVSSR